MSCVVLGAELIVAIAMTHECSPFPFCLPITIVALFCRRFPRLIISVVSFETIINSAFCSKVKQLEMIHLRLH